MEDQVILSRNIKGLFHVTFFLNNVTNSGVVTSRFRCKISRQCVINKLITHWNFLLQIRTLKYIFCAKGRG